MLEDYTNNILDQIADSFDGSTWLDEQTGLLSTLINSIENIDKKYRSKTVTNPDPTGNAKIVPNYFKSFGPINDNTTELYPIYKDVIGRYQE